MKLGKKGYMLVEIVLSSVLAFSIAFYLLNLTYKFKDTNQDIYQSIEYMTDKDLITKNIMNDLEKYSIVGSVKNSASQSSYNLSFSVKNNSTGVEEERKLEIKKENGSDVIIYGKYVNNSFDTNDVSYYKKSFPSSFMVDYGYGKINYQKKEEDFYISIPIQSIYSNQKYDIKIFALIV